MLGGEIARRGGTPLRARRPCWRRAPEARASARSCPRGSRCDLTGACNDYAGKGLSGGTLVVRPPEGAGVLPSRVWSSSAIPSSTARPAAAPTSRGQAGERFAVRNSGATAVVEGVGDHGCEYMTGGVVACSGRPVATSPRACRAAIAFVLDDDGTSPRRCNLEMVAARAAQRAADVELLTRCSSGTPSCTGSTTASDLLSDGSALAGRFGWSSPMTCAGLRRAHEPGGRAGASGVTDARGFLQIRRRVTPYRPVASAWATTATSATASTPGWRTTGAALHGLRRALLPEGLPAGQPDPGLERPGPARAVAAGARGTARDQQLPRVHRQAVPGAVRGGLRPGAERRRRSRSSRSRWRSSSARFDEGWVRAAAAARATRPTRGGGRLRPGRSGRGPAAHPRGPRGDRVRARPARRAGCCATASPTSRWRST